MRRRWLVVGGAALLGLVLLSGAGFFLFYGDIGAWVVRSKVIPRLSERLGRDLEVGGVEVSRGRVVLRDVVVRGPNDAEDEPLARIPRLVVDYDFWASLRGKVEVEELVVEDAVITLVRREDGSDNARDLWEKLAGGGEGEGGAGGGGRLSLRPAVAEVRGARIEVRDRTTGARLVAGDVGASLEQTGTVNVDFGDVTARTPFGPRAHLAGATLSFDLEDPLGTAAFGVGAGEARLWKGMTLTGIEGNLYRGEEPGRLYVDLAGGYGGAPGTLWRAEGWLEPRERTGNVRLAADRFTFDRIAPVLEESPFILDYEETSIDVAVEVSLSPERIELDGDVALEGLNLQHPMVAEEAVRDVSASGELDAFYDREARVVGIRKASLSSGGVEAELDGRLMLPGGPGEDGGEREEPALEARLVVPPVPCQTALESIPEEFVPELQGFTLRGEFGTDVRVAIDWADLEATELEGSVGIEGCRVLEAPGKLSARRLTGSFEVEVPVDEEETMTILIGSESEDFVPLWDVSPHLVNSFMTTEDSAFYHHRGFIPREFQSALIRDLQAGYFKYGASSITMQMVKNVLLSRDKTLSRKFQELFLTWYVETKLDKDRIMEIYVNAIEYGPSLYGLKPASETYFGKHPRYLNPVESAFFSSILPGPRRRYKQFCRGEPSRWTKGKIERVLWHMHDRDRLTEEEYELALETPLEFNDDEAARSELCRRR